MVASVALLADLPRIVNRPNDDTNEFYLTKQVQAGRVADFGERPSRELNAEAVSDAIFGMVSSGVSAPIVIKDAVIQGELDAVRDSRPVQRAVVFEGCTFLDPVDFTFARFEKDVTFEKSTFKKSIVLANAEVKGSLHFTEDVSENVAMANIRIGGDLTFFHLKSAAIFLVQSEAQSASFYFNFPLKMFVVSQLKAGAISIYGPENESNDGPLTGVMEKLLSSDAGRLSLHQLNGPATTVAEMAIVNTSVTGSIYIDNLSLGELDLSGTQAAASTTMGGDIKIKKLLQLSQSRHGSFIWLKDPGEWPQSIEASEMNISAISVSREVGDSEQTFEFFKHATNAEVPLGLYETQLRNRGQFSKANDAYALMRSARKREAVANSEGIIAKLSSYLFYILDTAQMLFLGYGRFPGPPLFWSACIVVAGTYIFKDVRGMELKDSKKRASLSPKPGWQSTSSKGYSAFWYSLELFLPVVDLGVAKNWKPKPDNRGLQTYARCHQLAGWILVPVCLAALTGVLK